MCGSSDLPKGHSVKCKMYKLSACSEVVRLQIEFQPGRTARSKASLFANQGDVGSSPGLATYFRGDVS